MYVQRKLATFFTPNTGNGKDEPPDELAADAEDNDGVSETIRDDGYETGNDGGNHGWCHGGKWWWGTEVICVYIKF